MKTYYTKEETPIKFHKFNHYFFLPLRFFALAISISSVIANFQAYASSGLLATLFLAVLSCVLIVITFVGFFQWTAYSFYALFAYFVFDVISAAYNMMVSLRYFPEEDASAIGRFCGTAVVAILICVYYWNRRNLFIHKSVQLTTSSISIPERGIAPTNEVLPTPPIQKEKAPEAEIAGTNTGIKFCRKCGKKLLAESVFCSYCGKKVIWEE